jgi:hypothetical protein
VHEQIVERSETHNFPTRPDEEATNSFATRKVCRGLARVQRDQAYDNKAIDSIKYGSLDLYYASCFATALRLQLFSRCTALRTIVHGYNNSFIVDQVEV